MVATRRGAKKAPEIALAPSNTLNAPPKRGRKKVVEEAAETAPVPTKPTKTTAVKRKAKVEPEDAELPTTKKTVATKGPRTVKVQTEAVPAPAPATRATRSRKKSTAAEEAETIEEVTKPTVTRTRKFTEVKKAPVPIVEKPTVAAEPAVEESSRPASRAVRKAPTNKASVTKKREPAVIQKTVASEPAKPAPRTRKAAVTKASASAPVIAPRATRGRNAPAVTQESPLKAPARKPTNKAAAVTTANSELELVAEPIEEPVEAVEEAVAEIVGEPVVVDEDAAMEEVEKLVVEAVGGPFAEFPSYPTTPTHITAPVTSREAIAELPCYPTTPSHILAPLSSKAALAEFAGCQMAPAHITTPVVAAIPEVQIDGMEHEHDDVAIEDVGESDAVEQTKACQASTPAEGETERTVEEPGGPQHIGTPRIAEETNHKGFQATVDVSSTSASKNLIFVQPETRYYTTIPTENSIVDIPGTPPARIVTDREAFEELPEVYRTTSAHIAALATSKAALAEFPDSPKTPAQIEAPVTPHHALAKLPDYSTTPSLALESAVQEEITASINNQTSSPLRCPTLKNDSFLFEEPSEIADFSEVTEARKHSGVVVADIAVEASPIALKPTMQLASLQLAPTFAAPEPTSPKKSALRPSRKVMDAKTPKKTVAWSDVRADENDLFIYDGILQGTVFYVDVTSNGRQQNFLFRGLLEDLGAKVVQDISHASLSHVLFKDGSMSTLEKCLECKGAIKCVNVGWVLDSESNKKRMDEDHYLVDLSVAKPATPLPTTSAKPFTPLKTPSKYALPPSSQCKMPSTPTSSEFDRSFNDDKENCEVGMFFEDRSPLAPRTVPNKKSSFLFSRSAVRTPSRSILCGATPSKVTLSAVKPAQAVTTAKKRSAESSFFHSSLGPPKKLRLF